jgi:hypothetical protein
MRFLPGRLTFADIVRKKASVNFIAVGLTNISQLFGLVPLGILGLGDEVFVNWTATPTWTIAGYQTITLSFTDNNNPGLITWFDNRPFAGVTSHIHQNGSLELWVGAARGRVTLAGNVDLRVTGLTSAVGPDVVSMTGLQVSVYVIAAG